MARYCVCFDEYILLYFIFDEQVGEALGNYYDTENDARNKLAELELRLDIKEA